MCRLPLDGRRGCEEILTHCSPARFARRRLLLLRRRLLGFRGLVAAACPTMDVAPLGQPILAQSPQVFVRNERPRAPLPSKASNFNRFAPGRLKPCAADVAERAVPVGWPRVVLHHEGRVARCMCVPRSSEILEINIQACCLAAASRQLDFFGPCRRAYATASGVRMSSSRYVVGTVSCASKFPRRRETANVAALTIGHGGNLGRTLLSGRFFGRLTHLLAFAKVRRVGAAPVHPMPVVHGTVVEEAPSSPAAV